MDEKLFPSAKSAEEYLGQFMGHDLYWDSQGGAWPTVVARFGAGLDEYKSGLLAAAEDAHLGEAKRRAEARGLKVELGDARFSEIIKAIPAQYRMFSGSQGQTKLVCIMMSPEEGTGNTDNRWVALDFDTPAKVCSFMSEIFAEGLTVFGREAMLAEAAKRGPNSI